MWVDGVGSGGRAVPPSTSPPRRGESLEWDVIGGCRREGTGERMRLCGGCGAVVGGVKGGEVIMVRPEGSGLEEGGVVGAGGKEQVKG